jgi:hypothetical protein
MSDVEWPEPADQPADQPAEPWAVEEEDEPSEGGDAD